MVSAVARHTVRKQFIISESFPSQQCASNVPFGQMMFFLLPVVRRLASCSNLFLTHSLVGVAARWSRIHPTLYYTCLLSRSLPSSDPLLHTPPSLRCHCPLMCSHLSPVWLQCVCRTAYPLSSMSSGMGRRSGRGEFSISSSLTVNTWQY